MANDEKAIINRRRAFLIETIKFDQLKGLEIGPLTAPLVTKEELNGRGEIFYLDHMPTDELREKYADDPSVDVEKIIPVDFVCRDGNIVGATSGNTFDYIIASHVIEHAPNLLQFLTEIERILKPGGLCILIIPDKRFTFDLNRPVTTFGCVLENFIGKQKMPNISAVYDHFATAVHANGHNLWHGIVNSKDAQLLVSSDFAWDAAHCVYDNQKYYDVHVNIFTPKSFFSILKSAMEHEMIFFEVDKFGDTQIGQIEFMVALKKPVNSEDKASCIETFPELNIENILSPYMPQVKSLSLALENATQLNVTLQKELEQLRIMKSAELDKLEDQLSLAQKVLDRRAVRMLLFLIDRIFKVFR
tara:strand:- start:3017 stop:4096 length:1080 start_codon:yes stop_codon:yes gene_type:complete